MDNIKNPLTLITLCTFRGLLYGALTGTITGIFFFIIGALYGLPIGGIFGLLFGFVNGVVLAVCRNRIDDASHIITKAVTRRTICLITSAVLHTFICIICYNIDNFTFVIAMAAIPSIIGSAIVGANWVSKHDEIPEPLYHAAPVVDEGNVWPPAPHV